jgi:hypothetical protein
VHGRLGHADDDRAFAVIGARHGTSLHSWQTSDWAEKG